MTSVTAVSEKEWEANQQWERESWGSNIFIENNQDEIIKQNNYAIAMQIVNNVNEFPIDLKNKSVVDIGCGPISLLLRSVNGARLTAVDPLFYSAEVDQNYTNKNIKLVRVAAENFIDDFLYDEVWMYNCLQHVIDPVKILKKILSFGKVLKIFEWLDVDPHHGHPHKLQADLFVETLDLKQGDYKIVNYNSGCMCGRAIAVNKNL